MHLGYVGQPDRATDRAHTIRGRSFGGTQNAADCVARALQTIVAAEKGLGEDEAPDLEQIKAEVDAAVGQRNAVAKANVEKNTMLQTASDWNKGGIAASDAAYGHIMANVLAQYGISVSSDPKEEGKPGLTMKALTDKLIAKGTPTMLNVGDNVRNEHSVTVQWDPHAGNDGKGRFLVDNLLADGKTREFTKQEFESGTLKVGHTSTHSSTGQAVTRISIKREFPVIYVERH